MTTLLHISASSRQSDSHTREMAQFFIEAFVKVHQTTQVINRNLVSQPVNHISDATIRGFYTSKEQRNAKLKKALELSDCLINELKKADVLLISTPMYNFSIPSALKAWIDQITRIGETFNSNFEGLLTNKKAYVVTAMGSSEQIMHDMDFLKPYLKHILGFIGFNSIQLFTLEGTTTDEKLFMQSKRDVQQKIVSLGENL